MMKENQLISLCGYAQSGKDTAAAHMPGWKRFAFADALKADLMPLLERIGCRLTEPYHKAMARDLLVEWGRTARKFKPDFWIRRAFDGRNGIMAEMQAGHRIVVTDVRYPNECERILAEGGIVVIISRPRVRAANDEERLTIAQIRERFPCLPTVENDGSKEDLGQRVLEVVAAYSAG